MPATRDRFYPFAGGLLEHTLSVTRSCLHLAERYTTHYMELRPPLNRDLVVAGAILHDIGRTLEFGEAIPGASPAYTVPGRLVGHLILGRLPQFQNPPEVRHRDDAALMRISAKGVACILNRERPRGNL